MKTYGYIRCLTDDEDDIDDQIIAMAELGVAEQNIYADAVSTEQPKLDELLTVLRPGDLLYINTLNALANGRNDIATQWRNITKTLRVDVVVADMPLIDTRRGKKQLGTLTSDVVYTMLEYMVDSPTFGYKLKQKEGIVRAKRSGRCGRPVKPRPEGLEEMCELWRNKQISAEEAAQQLGCTKAVFYYHARCLQDQAIQDEQNP